MLNIYIIEATFVIVALILLSWALAAPAKRYKEQINRQTVFNQFIGERRHTTSTSNALNEYRILIKQGHLVSPEDTNENYKTIYSFYKKKYPIRCLFIKKYSFNQDSTYKVILFNKSVYTVHSWTWERIKGFNPELERRLMTSALRLEIKKRDNYTCQYCKKYMPNDRPGEIHIDHIRPVSKGGKSTKANLQVLCASCNLEKSDKY